MAAVILDSCAAVADTLDDEGIATLNVFKSSCLKNSQKILTAHVNNDSLYEFDVSPVPLMSVACHNTSLDNASTFTVTCDRHY